MYYSNLKESKSGHLATQNPITLCFRSTQLLQATLTGTDKGSAYLNLSPRSHLAEGGKG